MADERDKKSGFAEREGALANVVEISDAVVAPKSQEGHPAPRRDNFLNISKEELNQVLLSYINAE